MTLNRMQKGIALALIHLALVGTLGAKLLIDRVTCPRVWVQTAPFDPYLPIRGRYVSLRLKVRVKTDDPITARTYGVVQSKLVVEDGQLVAVVLKDPSVGAGVQMVGDSGLLTEPVAFFIPEHALDPSRRPRSEELWVEVTIPKKGPPRPIRLGVKKDGGEIQPIEVH